MQVKRPIIILLLVCMILLIPFIGMQFSSEINWSFFDFLIAGVLLMGTGIMLELFLRKIKNRVLRFLLIVLLLIIVVLFWVEMAVGILGTPLSGN